MNKTTKKLPLYRKYFGNIYRKRLINCFYDGQKTNSIPAAGADNRTDALWTDALRTDPPTDRPFNGQNGFRSDTCFLIMNHSNQTNLKIICSIRQNQYQDHSIPSLGQVRPTQWGPSAVAKQARGPSAAARTGQGTEHCGQSRTGGRASKNLFKLCNRPNFRFGPMASLKTFYRGKEPNWPVAKLFDQMLWYFSVGFRWSVGRLKGRSDERRSVALPPPPRLHQEKMAVG